MEQHGKKRKHYGNTMETWLENQDVLGTLLGHSQYFWSQFIADLMDRFAGSHLDFIFLIIINYISLYKFYIILYYFILCILLCYFILLFYGFLINKRTTLLQKSLH